MKKALTLTPEGSNIPRMLGISPEREKYLDDRIDHIREHASENFSDGAVDEATKPDIMERSLYVFNKIYQTATNEEEAIYLFYILGCQVTKSRVQYNGLIRALESLAAK